MLQLRRPSSVDVVRFMSAEVALIAILTVNVVWKGTKGRLWCR